MTVLGLRNRPELAADHLDRMYGPDENAVEPVPAGSARWSQPGVECAV